MAGEISLERQNLAHREENVLFSTTLLGKELRSEIKLLLCATNLCSSEPRSMETIVRHLLWLRLAGSGGSDEGISVQVRGGISTIYA